jgi:uncharacterized cupin superfamily protein
MAKKLKLLLKASQVAAMPQVEAHHPLNPKSEVHIRSLGDAVGLQRLGVHLARLPQGKESNIYHTHQYEEEFFYVLSGRGVARIDGRNHRVGPGDFFAFPAPSVGHVLFNPHEEDLLYLVGGERRRFEVAEFPGIGKTLVRDGMRVAVVDSGAFKTFAWRRGRRAVRRPRRG